MTYQVIYILGELPAFAVITKSQTKENDPTPLLQESKKPELSKAKILLSKNTKNTEEGSKPENSKISIDVDFTFIEEEARQTLLFKSVS